MTQGTRACISCPWAVSALRSTDTAPWQAITRTPCVKRARGHGYFLAGKPICTGLRSALLYHSHQISLSAQWRILAYNMLYSLTEPKFPCWRTDSHQNTVTQLFDGVKPVKLEISRTVVQTCYERSKSTLRGQLGVTGYFFIPHMGLSFEHQKHVGVPDSAVGRKTGWTNPVSGRDKKVSFHSGVTQHPPEVVPPVRETRNFNE